MKGLQLHPWNVTPREAAQIQLRLRERFEPADRFGEIRRVAGADVALDLRRKIAIAGVVVYSFPDMAELERVWAKRRLTFPYVPGLLSFRETPVLIRAFAKLRHPPDLIFSDGHGYAHPRRFGIACHLGVVLDCPTIGCAKSIDEGETIAAVLRTRENTKPVYVSQGHRVSLESAVRFARATIDGFRIPRPTRDADHFVEQVKRMQEDTTS